MANQLDELIQYILTNSNRGECQCGKCCDKAPDRDAPAHNVNVHFFWVSKDDKCDPDELRRLIIAGYPDVERLKAGPSYIEIGGALGSQDIALRLMGLGELCGLWDVITPAKLRMEGPIADQMAGNGFVMITGIR